MAKNENRPNIALVCTECKHENYVTVKNKKNTTEKLNSRYFPVVGWAAELHYIWGGWTQKSTSQDNTFPTDRKPVRFKEPIVS